MEQTQKEDQTPFNISKFYMWRCVITMAHADDLLHEDELEYLENVFSNMVRVGMSDEQLATLRDDLKTPHDVSEFLPLVEDPVYRGQIVYFARLLACKDGEFHPSEESLLAKLHVTVTEGLDVEGICEDVHRNVQQELILHDAEINAEIDAESSKKSLSDLLGELASHFGLNLSKD